MLDWQTLDASTFVAAINKAGSDPDIAANMAVAHSLFRDEKETPQARAVWAIEYVIRHGGAQFLKPSSLSLAWYQYHLLDVIFVILSLTTLTTIITIFCCIKCCRCIFWRDSKMKKE